MILTEKIKQDIKTHALVDKPRECCGFVLYNEGKDRFETFKCKNIANNPVNFVEVDSREYLLAKDLGDIIYFYHSHRDKNKLSAIDEKERLFNQLDYLIYDINSDEFIVNKKETRFNSYLGRKFKIGKTDCYNLIVDFYREELKIVIPNILPERKTNWFKDSKNYILENLNKTNFVIMGDKSLKQNDLIVMDYGNFRWHFAIYLGDGLILHHPRNSESQIEEYKENLKQITKYILRQNDN